MKKVVLPNGTTVFWLRYVGWLVTTPILIVHTTSLVGPGVLDLRLMKMVICNQARLVAM